MISKNIYLTIPFLIFLGFQQIGKEIGISLFEILYTGNFCKIDDINTQLSHQSFFSFMVAFPECYKIGWTYSVSTYHIPKPPYPRLKVWVVTRKANQAHQAFQETLSCRIHHLRMFHRIFAIVLLGHNIRADVWEASMQFDNTR